MNPYCFVPLNGTPQRLRAAGHDRFSGHSGRFDCSLTLRTPLFVYDRRFARAAEPPAGPGHETADFPTLPDGRPVIWGTALRGALRAVAEAASPSCLTLFDGHYERWMVDYRPQLPPAYRRCDNVDLLCPACRVFGTIAAGRSGYAAPLRISDALPAADDVRPAERITLPPLQSPKPHHRAFYLAADGAIAGRKFYYHHPNGPVATIERSRFTRTVQPLPVGTTLQFTADYRNLGDDELRLLLFSLVLEPGLGHKLGLGKPVGMGSVTIELTSARNQTAREAALQRAGSAFSGDDLQEWVDALLYPLRNGAAGDLSALRQALALNPGRPVAYPPAEWFRTHPDAPIGEAPDLAPQAAPRRPAPVAAPRPPAPAAAAPTVGPSASAGTRVPAVGPSRRALPRAVAVSVPKKTKTLQGRGGRPAGDATSANSARRAAPIASRDRPSRPR